MIGLGVSSSRIHRSLLVLFTLLFPVGLSAQSFTMMSWNIQDLGRTKEAPQLATMVEVMQAYDLVLVQEVVAKDPAGAQKVAALADALNRTGARWDYRISDPTNSPSPYISERYAILWKPSKLQIQSPARLDAQLEALCDREPYLARFRVTGDTTRFWVANMHARRFDNHPEEELQHLVQYPERFGTAAVIIAGDFNLGEDHAVWLPLKAKGFRSALRGVPTTLKRSCVGSEYFNHAIDNIFFSEAIFIWRRSGSVDFVQNCESLEASRKVSDHVPVWVELELK